MIKNRKPNNEYPTLLALGYAFSAKLKTSSEGVLYAKNKHITLESNFRNNGISANENLARLPIAYERAKDGLFSALKNIYKQALVHVVNQVRKDPDNFTSLPAHLRDDESLALIAIEEDQTIINDVSWRLQMDKDFMCKALHLNPGVYECANHIIKSDPDIAKLAVSLHSRNSYSVPKDLRIELGIKT